MFKLRIRTDNQAFEDKVGEVVRILEEAIIKLKEGKKESSLLDINGNVVGNYTLTNRK